jgi:hypothetical protein
MKEEQFFIQARPIANKAQECRDDDEEKKLLFVELRAVQASSNHIFLRIFFEYHPFLTKEEFFLEARSIANKHAHLCRDDDEEKKLLFV